MGLKLEFWDEEDAVISKWLPQKGYEGFMDVLHGGIQATMLDEIGNWAVQLRCKTAGVTSSMEISYRRPVLISSGEITLRATIVDAGTRIAIVKAELIGNDGQVCATAQIKYFLFNPEKASETYFYPGADAFYDN